jgi:hypothetical protein
MEAHMGKIAGLPRRANQGGQGKTEYIIIIALIVIAAIGAYSFFGQTTRQQDSGVIEKDPSGKMATKDVAGDQGAAGQVPPKPGEPKAGDSKSAGGLK